MTEEYVLITGANGEIGHALIQTLSNRENCQVIALDIHPLDSSLTSSCAEFVEGDILDEQLIESLGNRYNFKTIFHLASILSTSAEVRPALAQRVNVQGTVNLLEMAQKQSAKLHVPVKFIYPSSIAVYGVPPKQKKQIGIVSEDEWLNPITMYGCNKLAAEQLGQYYANYYQLLKQEQDRVRLDFRALRFPGLISSLTVPTGGTSDYGPEMLHHAAQNLPYYCFVRPDASLPFMVMADAVKSLLLLADAPKANLSRSQYNVTSFSLTAEELVSITKSHFPHADITYCVHPTRQMIVDSWPVDINDQSARDDWGWKPDYGLEKAFSDYLVPAIRERYGVKI